MSLELLALGLETIGGLFGSSSQKSQQKAQMRQAQAQFDAQMDQSVQRRVQDAKKAGVHPLFALGASAGASPTISASGEQRGDPMQSALTSMAKALGVIEQNRASAKRDEAEAALLDSERRRIEGELNYKGQDGGALTVFGNPRKLDALGNVINQPEGVQLNPDGSMTVPQEVKAHGRPGVAGGVHPSRIEVMTETGQKYTLPNPDMGMDEVGQIEFVLGLPGRIWTDITNHRRKSEEVRKLDRELTRLRTLRENPDKVREAQALADRINRKISYWYKKAKEYMQ